MTPFYWESAHGNFGDDLNLWLWDFLLPGFRDVHSDVLLVGVGTVLNRALLPADGRKLVIGSGFGYGALPDMTDKSLWDIRSVRGPRTAEKLGIDPEFGIIDPAVMVADMPEFRNLPKTNGTIFVPHWESTIGSIWPAVCQTVGVTYVDPRGETKAVISAIAQSELVIAESMHAAILADAFRVPWVAVSTSEEINAFKWSDWADTVEVAYRPRQIPVSSRNEAMHKGARFWGMRFENRWRTVDDPNKRGGDTLVAAKVEPRQSTVRTMAKQVLAAPSAMALWQAKRATPQLSSDTVLARRKERFLEVIAGVQRDYF